MAEELKGVRIGFALITTGDDDVAVSIMDTLQEAKAARERILRKLLKEAFREPSDNHGRTV